MPRCANGWAGKAGEFVRDNFAVEKMVDTLYHLYLKLAAERGLHVP